MKADKINITETVESARKLLEADKKISPALRVDRANNPLINGAGR